MALDTPARWPGNRGSVDGADGDQSLLHFGCPLFCLSSDWKQPTPIRVKKRPRSDPQPGVMHRHGATTMLGPWRSRSTMSFIRTGTATAGAQRFNSRSIGPGELVGTIGRGCFGGDGGGGTDHPARNDALAHGRARVYQRTHTCARARARGRARTRPRTRTHVRTHIYTHAHARTHNTCTPAHTHTRRGRTEFS